MIGRGFLWLILGAMLVVGLTGAKRAHCGAYEVANACAAACYAAHTQCRMATKGSSACDATLASCLRACNARR